MRIVALKITIFFFSNYVVCFYFWMNDQQKENNFFYKFNRSIHISDFSPFCIFVFKFHLRPTHIFRLIQINVFRTLLYIFNLKFQISPFRKTRT